jgi:DNA polymerase III subunit gamma/tau
MATQSLYRRFRPRKFSELYGQDHVVRALRNAVVNHREGQAYLFSGPRGTGKTSTARILAKVLNCENPRDGEPCCECDSCKSVELGTSYDVLELDAASHNGVQEIRDIIDAAALTSPGRHRVFILDEVHMLTRAAEAALLKTLEEPPEQVVFVLATTDPQKVSETIRSRVQHLQFHLLPMDELEKYVRFVASEAQLDVDDADIEMVLRQGGGSARDTLSALELVAAGGGEPEYAVYTEEIVQAIIDRNHGAALASVARAMQQGRDAQTYAQDIVRVMRDCFLSLMSPELVQLPTARVEELNRYARELGAQKIVSVMETLGTAMVEMRHAPDARLLLEVAVVQLSSPSFDDSTENLLARISQLEDAVKKLKESGVASALPPPPVNPTTGKAKIGGRAGGAASTSTRDITAQTPQSAPVEQSSSPSGDPIQMWPQITDTMKGLAKAMFKPAVAESFDGKVLTIKLPANTPVKRAEDQSKSVTEAVKSLCGLTCVVKFVQADPTGGIERPVIDDAPKTIDKIVAEDPFAAIDLAETIPAEDALDPMLEALQNSFPGGSLVDDDSSSAQ